MKKTKRYFPSRTKGRRRNDTGGEERPLPFRYVGKHRRASFKDVLALKAKLDASQKALDALAEDTEDLISHHGL